MERETEKRPHSIATIFPFSEKTEEIPARERESTRSRRVKSAFAKSPMVTPAPIRRGKVPMATVLIPPPKPKEEMPKTYEDALKKYGWKFEVHNDPLNLKYVLLITISFPEDSISSIKFNSQLNFFLRITLST